MIGNNNCQIVFLIGAARSGTRLLRDLLAEHPEVDRVPYDINYIWRLGNEHVPHDELSSEMATPEAARRVQKKVYAYHAGGSVLIEKTVSNCLRIPFLLAIFPEARFIHLLRDGMDVIESAYRQWSAPPDWRYVLKKAAQFPFIDALGYAFNYTRQTLKRSFFKGRGIPEAWGPRYRGMDEDIRAKDLIEVCAIQWSRCVEQAWEHLSSLPEGYTLLVQYEELVREPLTQLQRIARFLQIDPAFYTSLNHRDIIHIHHIGKGKKYLTAEQIEVIRPYLERINTLLSSQWIPEKS